MDSYENYVLDTLPPKSEKGTVIHDFFEFRSRIPHI